MKQNQQILKIAISVNSAENPISIKSVINRLAGLPNIVGGFTFAVSLAGIMVTHPMTKTFHSALHLILSFSGLLLFIGISFYAINNRKRMDLVGLLGVSLTLLGFLLYIIGGFNYAIFHGLLNLVSINDPIHQIPLNIAPNVLSAGTLLTGAGALQSKTIMRPTAIFLIVAALIFFVGWQLIGFSMIRFSNKSRYVKAFLITLPVGLAWCCFGFEQLLKRSTSE